MQLALAFVAMIVSIALLLSIYFLYPAYKVKTLQAALDKHIPFAATHMATIAGTGVPPHMIFRMIGEFEEYEEVSAACREIYRNISAVSYTHLTLPTKA